MDMLTRAQQGSESKSREAAWKIERPRCWWAANTEFGLEAAQDRPNDECVEGGARA